MNDPKLRTSLLAAGLLSLTAWTAPALAGHANAVLSAELDGREEVAAAPNSRGIAGDPNARGNAYVFGVDGDPRTLCYLIVDVRKLAETEAAPGGGRAAHIHEGPRGSNGPVVANLAWPQDGQSADCLTEGEMDPSGPKFPTSEAGIVQRILSNPADFYINVHNSQYPAGAIRGQLGETEHEHGAASKAKR
ncbi:CHRD domain-containing protein [Ramlibacter sp. AN1015]|uniref:CHRD domain-containing protein n=1 Tax=Ramlibacter sp. AN1015 TaxID=3133428 RepID=UPI0030BD1233